MVGFDREQAPRESSTAARGRLARRRRCGSGSRTTTSPCAATRLRELLPDRVELVPAGGAVEALRAVKDARRSPPSAAAAALADEVYAVLREQGLVGPDGARGGVRARARDAPARRRGPELRVDRRLGRARRAPARRAADVRDPAGRWSRSTSARGSTATARTARARGRPASCRRPAEAYAARPRAQAAALAAVRPGPTGREVDAVARDLIAAAGHGEHFGHGLGHGVGLEVHEGAAAGARARAPLVAGNVVTVEPGVYLPGRGGVRIEDLVVVTEDGRAVLSGTTKDLITSTRAGDNPLKPAARSADTGGDGTPSPHPPNAAPRRRWPRAAAAAAPRRGHAPPRPPRAPPVVKSVAPRGLRRPDADDPRPPLPPRPQQEHRRLQAQGAKLVFVKAEQAAPQAAEGQAAQAPREGPARPERHAGAHAASRIRVLSSRFGKRPTRASPSPIVGPRSRRRPTQAAGRTQRRLRRRRRINRVDTDDDNDLLDRRRREGLDLDACKADTDGDGVEDGYEYQSAATSTTTSTRGPTTTSRTREAPYPNALDKTDADRPRRRR